MVPIGSRDIKDRAFDARAFSSVGRERLPYKQDVGGSSPSTPTTIMFLHNDEMDSLQVGLETK